MDGGRDPMLAEIEKWGIEYVFVPRPKKNISSEKEQKKYDKGFAGLSMTDLKTLVKKHEQQRLLVLVEEDKTVKIEIDKIKHIKPLSDELKQWMPKQWQIYKRKKGLIIDDEEAASLTA